MVLDKGFFNKRGASPLNHPPSFANFFNYLMIKCSLALCFYTSPSVWIRALIISMGCVMAVAIIPLSTPAVILWMPRYFSSSYII